MNTSSSPISTLSTKLPFGKTSSETTLSSSSRRLFTGLPLEKASSGAFLPSLAKLSTKVPLPKTSVSAYSPDDIVVFLGKVRKRAELVKTSDSEENIAHHLLTCTVLV